MHTLPFMTSGSFQQTMGCIGSERVFICWLESAVDEGRGAWALFIPHCAVLNAGAKTHTPEP